MMLGPTGRTPPTTGRVAHYPGGHGLEVAGAGRGQGADVFVALTIEGGMLTNVYGYDNHHAEHVHRANQDATTASRQIPRAKVDLDTAMTTRPFHPGRAGVGTRAVGLQTP